MLKYINDMLKRSTSVRRNVSSAKLCSHLEDMLATLWPSLQANNPSMEVTASEATSCKYSKCCCSQMDQ